MISINPTRTIVSRAIVCLFAAGLPMGACGNDSVVDAGPDASTTTETVQADASAASGDSGDTGTVAGGVAPPDEAVTFRIEIWADNWMAVHVNGELIGEDSVSITTERSFNDELFTFEAAYPFTVAVEAKDFKETDSGLEYIGDGNQQMGDGGIIAQVTDTSSGQVVAVTDSSWQALVVHRAPLNPECEGDVDPDATCVFEVVETPSDWTTAGFDDGDWPSATEWTAADVGPKDGFDEIDWDAAAQLIWGTDLEVDNTILLRATVTG